MNLLFETVWLLRVKDYMTMCTSCRIDHQKERMNRLCQLKKDFIQVIEENYSCPIHRVFHFSIIISFIILHLSKFTSMNCRRYKSVVTILYSRIDYQLIFYRDNRKRRKDYTMFTRKDMS